nr:Ig-like domain-containing protein [uncultured Nitrososphaera sp.]
MGIKRTGIGRRNDRITIAATAMAAILVMAIAGQTQSAHAAVASSCNCVVFRLDDIQDSWLHNVQLATLNQFNNTKVSTGLIMNFYGNDAPIVAKIQAGHDAGFTEYALHGWNHVDYAQLSLADQQSTLQQAYNKLVQLHGVGTNIFIAPDNSVNSNTLLAMQSDNLNILSADVVPDNGYLPATYPPADSTTGVKSLPMTVNFVDTHKAAGHNGQTVSQLNTLINNSLATRGFAVVMLHPQDFAQYSGTTALNIVNATQINTLSTLIAQLKADGKTMTDFNGLVAAIDALPPPADTTKPTGAITSPAAESAVTTDTPFTVSGTASDNVNVALVEVRITNAAGTAGTPYVAATLGGANSWTSVQTTSSTLYDTIRVRITDSSGNQNWLATHMVVSGNTPDTTKPAISVGSPTQGQSITFGSTVSITGTATDNKAVTGVDVRVTNPDGSAGTTYAPATMTGGGNSWSINLTLNNSQYTRIVARASDAAGNQEWAFVNFVLASAPDMTKPSLAITMPPGGATVTAGQQFTVSGTASDAESGLALVEVRTDSLTYSNATVNGSTWTKAITMTQTGQHTIVAHAIDNAGNQQWVVLTVTVQ